MPMDFSPAHSTQEIPSPPKPDAPLPTVRPWMRFWARLVDMLIFATVLQVAAALIFPSWEWSPVVFIWIPHIHAHIHDDLRFIEIYILGFISPLASIFAYTMFEAMLLNTVGTTVGKWLF